MENYIVSRELAEKLKATGYPQDSQHRYYIGDGYDGKLMDEHYWMQHFADEAIREGDIVAAPLSDELLDALTEVMTGLTLYHNHGYMQWEAFYAGKFFEYGADGTHFDSMADKPADALAELWLWAKEHKYV